MKYRLLGNSGLRVSEAALGTMTFGDDWGWGSAKDEARKVAEGIRCFPRGWGQFYRYRQPLHKRDQRIVPRRVYPGPPPEPRDGHEIQPRHSGHRSERGWQSAQEYGAGSGSEPQAAANRLHRSLLGP